MKSKKSFQCTYCQASLTRPHNLRGHERIHTGERPFECIHCHSVFRRKNDLHVHIRSKHEPNSEFICSIITDPSNSTLCGQKFTRKCNLKKHIRNSHSSHSSSEVQRSSQAASLSAVTDTGPQPGSQSPDTPSGLDYLSLQPSCPVADSPIISNDFSGDQLNDPPGCLSPIVHTYPLLEAIEQCLSVQTFISLLSTIKDINAKNEYSSTALHIAARNENSISYLTLLLQWGADLNARDIDSRTALHIACTALNLPGIKLLLDFKADIHITDVKGHWPNLGFLRSQRSRGYKKSELMPPAKYDVALAGVTRSFIEGGADIKHFSEDHNDTLLHFACCGYPELARLLIGCFPDLINSRDEIFRTPLHVACFERQFGVARLLIGAGANVKAKTKWGATPIHYSIIAHFEGHDAEEVLELIGLLISSGADPNTQDGHGQTALHYLAKNDSEGRLVRRLFEAGANPFIQNKDGKTALNGRYHAMRGLFNKLENNLDDLKRLNMDIDMLRTYLALLHHSCNSKSSDTMARSGDSEVE